MSNIWYIYLYIYKIKRTSGKLCNWYIFISGIRLMIYSKYLLKFSLFYKNDHFFMEKKLWEFKILMGYFFQQLLRIITIIKILLLFYFMVFYSFFGVIIKCTATCTSLGRTLLLLSIMMFVAYFLSNVA